VVRFTYRQIASDPERVAGLLERLIG